MINFHPPLTAFPLALFSVVTALELWLLFRPSQRVHFTARMLLVLGVLAVAAAFFSGYQASELANQSFEVSDEAIAAHHLVGKWLLFLSVPCLLLAWVYDRAKHARAGFKIAYLVSLFICMGLVIMSGWRGGELVFKHGAGVSAKLPQSK